MYSTPYNYSAPSSTIPPTVQPSLTPTSPAIRAWDPYADPGPVTQPIYSSPTYAQPGVVDPYAVPPNTYVSDPLGSTTTYIGEKYRETIRLLQGLRAQHTWLAGGDLQDDFDVNTLELSAAFAVPVGQIQQPILITPRFNFHWWAGPQSAGAPIPRDLPAQAYDAFLETSWKPQFTPLFGADLGVAVGVFSDFSYYDKNSLRVMGRGVGLITLTQNLQFALGVWYINRDRVKLLPAGGFIYRPNADTTYELLFPNPRATQRLFTSGSTDVFGYLAGEYGGGQWTITHDNGLRDVVNYNDMRIVLGVETVSHNRFRANFDIGYVFNREILYRDQTPTVNPSDTVMLRVGLQY